MLEISYISVCSGIEAASVAMSRIEGVNWHPVAFSEIDPFPCAVLAHHFPQVPNLGDLSKIHYNKETDELTNGATTIPLHGRRINAILGGTPCQSISIAGLRHGMQKGSGTRSSLFYEYARLVEEVHPDWLVFENVPGIFSSRGGRDFYAVICTLVNIGYSLAWRVLDAQYTVVDGFPRAVPQRRKRVWLVGCLGSDESVPAQILFERPGVLGDTPPRREAGQGFACPPGYCATGDDRVVGGAGRGCPEPAAPAAEGTAAGDDGGNRLGDAGGGRGNDAGEGEGTGGNGHGFDLQAFGKYGDGGGASTLKSRDWKDATDLAVQTTPMSPEASAPPTARGRTDRTSGSSCACDPRSCACGPALGFDARNTGLYGAGATGEEVSMTQDANQYKGGKAVVQGVNCLTLGHPEAHRVYGEDGAAPSVCANEGGGQNQQAVLVTNSNGEDVAPTLDTKTGALTGINGNNDARGGYVIATNSNGEDVMPPITASEYKGEQAQKDKGGGTLSMNFEMYDTAEETSVCLSAQRARDTMVAKEVSDER